MDAATAKAERPRWSATCTEVLLASVSRSAASKRPRAADQLNQLSMAFFWSETLFVCLELGCLGAVP